MPAKIFSVEEMLEGLESASVMKERAHAIDRDDLRELFTEEFSNCRINRRLFERIKRALQITTDAAFVLSFFNRVEGKNKALFRDPAKRQLALKRFLGKIEAVRPIVERLASKAKRQGLAARLEVQPLYLSSTAYFPTLVFSDAKGAVFWASFEPTGKSLSIKHIQGLKCRKGLGKIDHKKLERVEKALGRMGYKRLRDGLFNDICSASKGRFEKVHYLHPSRDLTFQIEPNLFHALARRQKLKKTKAKATKTLPKRRKR